MDSADGAGGPVPASVIDITGDLTPADAPVGPMGRPPGTVRAYLAIGIVGAFLAGHLGGAWVLLRAGAPESALALLGAVAIEAATVTGFYFGARQGEPRRDGR